MLRIEGTSSGTFCDRVSRRQFIKVGAVGALTLPQLLAAEAQAVFHKWGVENYGYFSTPSMQPLLKAQVVFKNQNFELKTKIKFTDKDFNIGMGSKTTITIKQNETILFKGEIDSQGCM